MENLKIYIIAHKPYIIPQLPECYETLQVGNGEKFANVKDNTGISIAERNSEYCELTGQYWIWKNRPTDFIGFVHYRRVFQDGLKNNAKIPSADFYYRLLKKYDWILPEPFPIIKGTVKEQFCMLHPEIIFKVATDVISQHSPNMLTAFNTIMNRKSISYYNMYVTKWANFDKYMQWLMPILDECYEKIDDTNFSTYNKRYIGFLAERLLNVWIEYNNSSYCFLPIKKTDEKEPILTKLKLKYIRREYRHYYPSYIR